MSKPKSKRLRDLTPLPVIQVGEATELVSIRSLEHEFQITYRSAINFLQALRVKPVFIGSHGYFSIQALDKALFYVTRIGGPGFAAPGSLIRDKRGRKIDAHYSTALTDEDIAHMETAAFRKEMSEAAKRRGYTAMSTLKKLVASSSAKSDAITADLTVQQEIAPIEDLGAAEDLPADSPIMESLLSDDHIDLNQDGITLDD